MQPLKVLTAAEMRQIDRKTVEAGIPSPILMENAGQRVVEYLADHFAPLSQHRIVVVCGKGNNGGDGFVVARQLLTRFTPKSLDVVATEPVADLTGDAAAAYRMWCACGGVVQQSITGAMRAATLVVDAVLGTGLNGAARGSALNAIREINTGFPAARIVSVDIPSGMQSDSGHSEGEFVRADATVTFTALKVSQALGPACYAAGELKLVEIGSAAILAREESIRLAQTSPATFRHLLAPRPRDSNKGNFGHVLVVAGARGKTGAAAMCGLAALRAGAGLVTVATTLSALPQVAGYAPELMTEPLAETPSGVLAEAALESATKLAKTRNVVALGPGLGTAPETAAVVQGLFRDLAQPAVVDADALNILAQSGWAAPAGLRVLTPHPGEMARLAGEPVKQIQERRVDVARHFATGRQVVLVLKGDRTLIAFPDGRVWINPTGSPAMATGGTGDILTGLIAGFLAQFPSDPDRAIAAAVYLHGLAGQKGACELGELPLIATDLLRFLPAAIHDCTHSF